MGSSELKRDSLDRKTSGSMTKYPSPVELIFFHAPTTNALPDIDIVDVNSVEPLTRTFNGVNRGLVPPFADSIVNACCNSPAGISIENFNPAMRTGPPL